MRFVSGLRLSVVRCTTHQPIIYQPGKEYMDEGWKCVSEDQPTQWKQNEMMLAK